MRVLSAALVAVFLASQAWAHSPMTGSQPEEGAVLAAAPDAIEMWFKHPVRLTKVTMTTASAETIDVDLADAKAFSGAFKLRLEGAPSGPVEIEWRALAKDGHAMKGVISFIVE